MTESAVAHRRRPNGRTGVETLRNYVGGRWVESRTREFLDVYNPARGEVIARTPLSTGEDVDAAVAAARKAFPAWRDTPPVDAGAGPLQVQGSARGALRGARAHRDDRARQDARRVAGQRAPRHRVRRGRLRDAVADDGLRPGEHRLRDRLQRHQAAPGRLRGDRSLQLPGDGPALVPSFRDRDRQHIHRQALRAGAPLPETDVRAAREVRPAARASSTSSTAAGRSSRRSATTPTSAPSPSSARLPSPGPCTSGPRTRASASRPSAAPRTSSS